MQYNIPRQCSTGVNAILAEFPIRGRAESLPPHLLSATQAATQSGLLTDSFLCFCPIILNATG
ncbi:uncharacterized protein TrAFT101_000294 [Trichoderma asperellum]|uniref:uncharacterized protein n=1 Tax=Trichoderma asperellum TaxID=101201 RepID=UPI0033279733|nr:hypothetical protein TrAFT101_000294 [Trichoderma asperellum]